jgi:hypothetical protein
LHYNVGRARCGPIQDWEHRHTGVATITGPVINPGVQPSGIATLLQRQQGIPFFKNRNLRNRPFFY